ncbi:glycerophosphodiester phosphodiesterase family protein [Luteimonas abyssi]|uniref:glycerophosphodiester phosphodiesterase family protein n=1 Tax=Luteimonas abyssi TaxID=1247514 RepID=UPI0009E9F5B3|nr:glycerophosphodiester phosphodiesterase family protein [Luteimonas abyssi]
MRPGSGHQAGGAFACRAFAVTVGAGILSALAWPVSARDLAPDVHAAIRATDGRPAVIAHRGASALRPEHTLAAYAKAIEDGADFIEPDLVMTRDGVLVARHENEIGETTDVAGHPAFAGRRTVREVDGQSVDGWFVEDFTLAELRTLRARERLPALRGTAHDGREGVPTFAEIVDAVAQASAAAGRTIGIVPELKHSTHFHGRGLDPEAALMAALQAHDYTRTAPVGVQSFEVGNLRRLRTLLDAAGLRNVFLVQLVGAPEASPFDLEQAGAPVSYLRMVSTAEGLADIAAYADVLAPHLRAVLPLDEDGALGAPTPLVPAAHAAGLAVHVWTLRPENPFLPPALRCGAQDARCDEGAGTEARAFAEAGVDALFGDDPGQLRRALDAR